ncbi:hypothetical protein FOZ62_022412, partial [Perkinsus olseni]
MARGDKTDREQVDDIKELELAGEPTAGYDADEVQKTIDEMEADREAHDEAKAKKDEKKTSATPWSYKEVRIYDDFGSDVVTVTICWPRPTRREEPIISSVMRIAPK